MVGTVVSWERIELNRKQVRIAETPRDGFVPLLGDLPSSAQLLDDLTRAIRRSLSPTAATLLATPEPTDDRVRWYAGLDGEPTPASDLPAAEREGLRAVLTERIAAIERLARELEKQGPEEARIGQALLAAIRYPDETCLYSVGGQPVLIWWGHLTPADAAGRGIGPLAKPGISARAVAWLAAVLGIALLGGTGFMLWKQHLDGQYQALASELESVLEGACSPREALVVLVERLRARDPERARYPDLWNKALAEQARCVEAAAADAALESAWLDCRDLASLKARITRQDLDREPFATINTRLAERLDQCTHANDLAGRLEASERRCDELMALWADVEVPAEPVSALSTVLSEIQSATLLCTESESLIQRLTADAGDCNRLRVLAGETSKLPLDAPALAAFKVRLDRELDDCDSADALAERLRAQDCVALSRLDAEPALKQPQGENLKRVRARLDALLAGCESLESLVQQVDTSEHNCSALPGLAVALAQQPENPKVIALRARVAAELEICDQATSLSKLVEAHADDCKDLDRVESALSAAPEGDPRFAPAREAHQMRQRICAEVAQLTAAEAALGDSCREIEALRARIPASPSQSSELRAMARRLDARLARCAAIAARCPGTRKIAPEMAIVFDASSSMTTHLGDQRVVPGAHANIDVAKDASRTLIERAPADVNIALVEVSDCAGARNRGKYTAAQRGALVSTISKIRTGDGTPLAGGILAAAQALDGRSTPGVIVVISDGADSCGYDPCAVARQIHKQRPKLTINVIAIGDTNVAQCIAAETGGQVFTARTAAQLRTTLERAVEEVQGPPECRLQ